MVPVMLQEPLNIGTITAKNRICIPPMVLFGHSGEDGLVTEAHVAHYTRLAKGGAGLIIQEATCVTKDGRLSADQLGIWSDEHVPGLKKIVHAIHGEGTPVVVQLHHGGIMSAVGRRPCPSDYEFRQDPGKERQKKAISEPVFVGEELSCDEIEQIRQDFIDGGRRAYAAGYDGVELHGCHSYLLCQFLNKHVNRRTDRYGDGLVFIQEIVEGIRAVTSPEFVIGIRLGAFEPTLAEGIAHAKALEAMGIQFMDVSYGFSGEMDFTVPGEDDMLPVIRAAGEIKKAVSVPVFAVDSIRTPVQAEEILRKTGVDMVDIGRSALVDSQWANKALRGETPGACLGCKTCQWRMDSKKCPGRRALG